MYIYRFKNFFIPLIDILSLSCIRARNKDNYTLSNITVTLHLYIDTYEFPVHMFIESSLFLIVKEEIIKKKQFSVSIRLLLTLKSYSLVILASILFWAAFRTFEIVYAYIHSLKAPYFSFSFFFSFFFLCIYHETIETIVLLLSYVFVYTYTKLFFNQGSGSRTLERIDHDASTSSVLENSLETAT